jgi:hypothetical protein
MKAEAMNDLLLPHQRGSSATNDQDLGIWLACCDCSHGLAVAGKTDEGSYVRMALLCLMMGTHHIGCTMRVISSRLVSRLRFLLP